MLLGALVVVVVGALAGTYLGVQGKLSGADGWLVGHQGYEYIELGRVWQVALHRRDAPLARPGRTGPSGRPSPPRRTRAA